MRKDDQIIKSVTEDSSLLGEEKVGQCFLGVAGWGMGDFGGFSRVTFGFFGL